MSESVVAKKETLDPSQRFRALLTRKGYVIYDYGKYTTVVEDGKEVLFDKPEKAADMVNYLNDLSVLMPRDPKVKFGGYS
jgi:hypothetical protein